MPGLNSFDIVSKIEMQEVRNAVDQARKELAQRFDFKGSQSSVTLEGDDLIVVSDDDYKLKSVVDILRSKLVKRGVSLKALTLGAVEPALGGTVRQKISLKQGISSEKAKEITQAIRDSKLKAQTQIQGDQVRVLSKSKDELQTVMALLKGQDFGLPLQFTNYR